VTAPAAIIGDGKIGAVQTCRLPMQSGRLAEQFVSHAFGDEDG
jgi:hypothetical protein